MERVQQYRIPLLTAVGALILALVVYVTWISHEGSKLSSLHGTETQLQTQQGSLQAEITMLKREKENLGPTCAKLTQDVTAVPASPQVDSFFHQVTALAVSSGDPNTPSISVTQATAGTTAAKGVPTSSIGVSLTLAGSYGQMTGFLKGMYSFPRLFTINTISIGGGPVSNGGVAPAAGTQNYTLALSGDIYYAAAQQNACLTSAS
jgi:Tfp pilus assembly protein PilO